MARAEFTLRGPGGRDFTKTAGPRGWGLAADPEGGSPGRTNSTSPVSPELEVARLGAARSGHGCAVQLLLPEVSEQHRELFMESAGVLRDERAQADPGRFGRQSPVSPCPRAWVRSHRSADIRGGRLLCLPSVPYSSPHGAPGGRDPAFALLDLSPLAEAL